MAQKYCCRRTACVHGVVLQDYSNFYRNATTHDQHCGECIDCMAKRRKDKLKEAKEMYSDKFRMFIGS